MNADLIKQIREYYNRTKDHETTQTKFGLSNGQGYAINILARDFKLTNEEIAARLPQLPDDPTTVGKVAKVMLTTKQYEAWLDSI